LGSEDDTALEIKFVISRGEKLSRAFSGFNQNADVIFGKIVLG
jgi:hypothetical protein